MRIPIRQTSRPAGQISFSLWFSRLLAFTLMEVMIACGIFFMATFAILALVSTTLRNARGLQRGDIDAGMAAAQVYQLLKTNKVQQGSLSGDFDEAHHDYSWEANWDIDYDSGATNGLL